MRYGKTMKQITKEDNKQKIMSSFHQLLTENEANGSKVATKEEEAEKARYRELLETAAMYTVDNIVNGTASLQLDFGGTVTNLAERLLDESKKLDALKKAIFIERSNLEQLQKIRVVADALDLLRKEHDEKLMTMETNITRQMEKIEKEMIQVRKSWAKEAIEYETGIKEEEALTAKKREQESDNYNYEEERRRRVEMDIYKEQKRMQERELHTQKQVKERDWKEREAFLAENLAEFEKNQSEIAGHEEELKKIYEDQKRKAIEQAKRDAKIKTDLTEKEWSSEKKGYDLRIAALETSIQRQIEQITELSSQLQSANNQAQNLAMRAFQNTKG